MKKEKYIVEIEMPNGDTASLMYIHDVIQSDCDIEDEDRWKVSVKEYWKPSESDIRILEQVIDGTANPINYHATLHAILEKLKKLREE